MRRLVFCWSFRSVTVVVLAGCISVVAHPVRDAPRFLRFPASQTASAIPLQVERRSAWPSEQSDFPRRRQRNSRGGAEARLLITNGIHPPFGGTGTVGAQRRNRSGPRNDSRPASSKSGGRSFASGRAQQALFAFVDSLAKVLLTCVPEPGGEAMEAAVARARGRHARLLKSAGQAMVGDSQVAMQDLVNRGEG